MMTFLIFLFQVSCVELILSQIVNLSQVGSFSRILELGFKKKYILRKKNHKIAVFCYLPHRLEIQKNQPYGERQISQVSKLPFPFESLSKMYFCPCSVCNCSSCPTAAFSLNLSLFFFLQRIKPLQFYVLAKETNTLI